MELKRFIFDFSSFKKKQNHVLGFFFIIHNLYLCPEKKNRMMKYNGGVPTFYPCFHAIFGELALVS